MTNTSTPAPTQAAPAAASGPAGADAPRPGLAMTAEQAAERMKEKFPFPFHPDHPMDAHVNIGNTVARHLKPGSKVLDFGAGPADKTAVVQLMGYQCTAYDDLQDTWHLEKDNRQKILNFAADLGINYVVATDRTLPFEPESFDMFMIHDVIEHLHDSPRDLFNSLMEKVKPGGLFYVTAPNAGNIRKRVDILRGRTNYSPFGVFYWNQGPWRGHIREYVHDDIVKLAEYMGLEVLELRSVHHMIQKVPRRARGLFRAVTTVFPGWRDTWQLVARRPPGWKPRYTLPPEELKKVLNVAHGYTWD